MVYVQLLMKRWKINTLPFVKNHLLGRGRFVRLRVLFRDLLGKLKQ